MSYHYAFCDLIPLNCIQLRNLVLSAYLQGSIPLQYDPKKLFYEKDIHETLKNYRAMYDQPSILTKYKVTIEFQLKNYLILACDSTRRLHGQVEGLHWKQNHGNIDHLFDQWTRQGFKFLKNLFNFFLHFSTSQKWAIFKLRQSSAPSGQSGTLVWSTQSYSTLVPKPFNK